MLEPLFKRLSFYETPSVDASEQKKYQHFFSVVSIACRYEVSLSCSNVIPKTTWTAIPSLTQLFRVPYSEQLLIFQAGLGSIHYSGCYKLLTNISSLTQLFQVSSRNSCCYSKLSLSQCTTQVATVTFPE